MAIQVYVPTDWVNDAAPPINAANLNHIEQGIKNATEGVNENASDIEVLQAAIPSGVIVMWSGSVVPSGWVLCNGDNGTPDLIGMFVRASGPYDAVGSPQTGGSADAIVPVHNHTMAFTSGSEGKHKHDSMTLLAAAGAAYSPDTAPYGTTGNTYTIGGGGGAAQTSRPSLWTSGAFSDTAGIDHTHAIIGTTHSEGESVTNANLPPFYNLAYIMKL